MLLRRSLVYRYTCFVGMKFSNGFVSAEDGSFNMVRIIRITCKVDNSDTRVATNEVRCAQNNDAIFSILNFSVLLTTTEIIKKCHSGEARLHRGFYREP